MSRLKPKHQRLTLISLALVAVIGAVLLAMWGLADRAAYFRTPADIVAGKSADGEPIRLGGMVENGSLNRADGTSVTFVVADGAAKVPVMYRGILPDLFREGSGMVAEGRMREGIFVADMILAKHDERYMPPQMGNQSAEHEVGKTLEQ
ncbi:MAG: cytochrome c maturation protein CcmE [Pseudomonadota bacterium]